MRILPVLLLLVVSGCATTPAHQASTNNKNSGQEAGQPCHMPTSSIDGAKYCFNEDAYLRSMTMR